ncbi:hypothetical protein LB554_16515 [Mesorhizobium sp. CO1-1-11]|uniref:PP_RS20740 family protein n=1 Tax=Mesorhizobium sp. CO1-1-11 TaxID=2876636 RepID=UPI001CCB08E6|nr:hypothetical protein [Mesorhizobium sp. CO1-1-11]MBZ9725552.1 hypothetical protein [Mesorhizobium sp. CO1-1-11]
MIDNTSDDDFSEISLPPETTTPASPEPLRFAPWHKPRKQYVRNKQWLHHIDAIVSKLGISNFVDGEPLRYMTLPGPDLLDIRMVAKFCSSKSIRLKYTGFCQSTDTEEKRLRQNVNEFSLTHQEAVVSSSKVVRSRVQDVGIKDSEAAVEMMKGGPFDVINIDACEPLASHNENVSGRLVDAIRSITEYQLRERRKPWLLLLTTPIQADSISSSSLSALNGQVITNVRNDSAFASELSDRFDNGEDAEAFLSRLSKTTGDGLISVFSLGIAKWLIHLAEQAKFKVIKLKGYSYSMFRQVPYDPNMVSLCFLFEPVQLSIQDTTGLTENNKVTASADNTLPISSHVRALRRAFEIENIDIKLQNDTALYEALVVESKDLLKQVGYLVDDAEEGYDAWLAKYQNSITDEAELV